jgi:hypothetical protein
MTKSVTISDDERTILVAMIRIEDNGHGGYGSDPDVRQRLHDKGLERHGKATEKARKMLGMPKPPPSPEEIAALRRWVNDGEVSGWALSALERRGLVCPFGKITDKGRAALASGEGE